MWNSKKPSIKTGSNIFGIPRDSGTPDRHNVSGHHSVPECWQRGFQQDSLYFGECLYGLILPRFDDTTGYYNCEDLGDHPDEILLEALRYVNLYRKKTREQLANVSADIQEFLRGSASRTTPGVAPYNALFVLLEKHGINTYPFFHDEYPSYKTGGTGCEIIPPNGNDKKFLEHLRPGLKLLYPDEDGAIVKTVLKECQYCYKIRDDVQTEFCGNFIGSVYCTYRACACRDCTTRATCTSCGGSYCNQPTCANFYTCCVPDCSNKMCSIHCTKYKGLDRISTIGVDVDGGDDWNGTSCLYMLSPGDGTNERAIYCEVIKGAHQGDRQFYCLAHKPDGPVPAPPYTIAIARLTGNMPLIRNTP